MNKNNIINFDSCDGYGCNSRHNCLLYQNFINKEKENLNILLIKDNKTKIANSRRVAIDNKCSFYQRGIVKK